MNLNATTGLLLTLSLFLAGCDTESRSANDISADQAAPAQTNGSPAASQDIAGQAESDNEPGTDLARPITGFDSERWRGAAAIERLPDGTVRIDDSSTDKYETAKWTLETSLPAANYTLTAQFGAETTSSYSSVRFRSGVDNTESFEFRFGTSAGEIDIPDDTDAVRNVDFSTNPDGSRTLKAVLTLPQTDLLRLDIYPARGPQFGISGEAATGSLSLQDISLTREAEM